MNTPPDHPTTELYESGSWSKDKPNPDHLGWTHHHCRQLTATTAGTHPDNVTVYIHPPIIDIDNAPHEGHHWWQKHTAIVTVQPGDYPLTNDQRWQVLESESHRIINNQRASKGAEPIPYTR